VLAIQLLNDFFYPIDTRKMRSLASLVRPRPSSFSWFSRASRAFRPLLLYLSIKLEIIGQYFTDAHRAFISLKCILNATTFIVIFFIFSKNHHFTS